MFADVVSIIFLIAFGIQWMRHDRRESRRVDRHLDRIHGASPTTRPWWEEQSGDLPTGNQPLLERRAVASAGGHDTEEVYFHDCHAEQRF
ncbi:MAG TPA: hypothetical protein VJ757_07445 [Pseudonocardiaceae bacterium]|nr:hypothetical protein [Pseudonocardiaceae bacterium]